MDESDLWNYRISDITVSPVNLKLDAGSIEVPLLAKSQLVACPKKYRSIDKIITGYQTSMHRHCENYRIAKA